MTDPNLALLNDALPPRFDFYHLGSVQLLPQHDGSDEPAVPEDPVAVAFSLQGEARGLLVLLFERGLDVSTYSELGNVIASRAASALGAMPSPPRLLGEGQLAALARTAPAEPVKRSYAHIFQGRLVMVHAWILPVPSEGTGYA